MRSRGPCPPLPDRGCLWSREGAEVRLDRLAAGASELGPRFYALYALSFLQCWGGHVDQPRPAGWTGVRTGPHGPTAPQGRAAVRLRHAGGPAPIGRTVPGAVPGARPLCSEPASRAGSSREGTPRRLSSSAAVTLGFQSQPHDGRLCAFRTSHVTFHASASSSMT